MALVVGVLVAAAAPAGAGTSTTGSLQAKASAIAAELARDNNQLNALGEQYLTAESEYEKASAAVVLIAGAARRIERVLVRDRRAVTAAAIGAYVGAGSTTDLGSFLVEKPDEVQVEQTYLRYAEGRLNGAISNFQGDEARLQVSLSTETRDVAAARLALLRTTTARAQAIGTLYREQRLYNSIQGQLAQLVAAQLAAQQAAETKAQAARTANQNQTGPPSLSGTAGLTGSPIPSGSLSQEFAELRHCESSGNYADDTGNGYYGAYQFALPTWLGLGETGLPNEAPPAVQDAAAYLMWQRDGWRPWPACSAILGL